MTWTIEQPTKASRFWVLRFGMIHPEIVETTGYPQWAYLDGKMESVEDLGIELWGPELVEPPRPLARKPPTEWMDLMARVVHDVIAKHGKPPRNVTSDHAELEQMQVATPGHGIVLIRTASHANWGHHGSVGTIGYDLEKHGRFYTWRPRA